MESSAGACMFKSDKIGFSRQERSAILILIIVLLAGLGTTYFKDTVRSQSAETLTHEDSLVLENLSRIARADRTSSSEDDSIAILIPNFDRPTGETLININTAGLEELQLLPGIGPVLAARIIEYRIESGPFEAPDSLINVRGIGETKLNRILSIITIEIPRRED